MVLSWIYAICLFIYLFICAIPCPCPLPMSIAFDLIRFRPQNHNSMHALQYLHLKMHLAFVHLCICAFVHLESESICVVLDAIYLFVPFHVPCPCPLHSIRSDSDRDNFLLESRRLRDELREDAAGADRLLEAIGWCYENAGLKVYRSHFGLSKLLLGGFGGVYIAAIIIWPYFTCSNTYTRMLIGNIYLYVYCCNNNMAIVYLPEYLYSNRESTCIYIAAIIIWPYFTCPNTYTRIGNLLVYILLQ